MPSIFLSAETPLDPTAAPKSGQLSATGLSLCGVAGLLFLSLAGAQQFQYGQQWQALEHVRQGGKLLDAQEYKRAYKSFAEAVRLDPQLADAHYGLGMCALMIGQTEQALEEGRLASELA